MIDTRPVVLTDAQWSALEKNADDCVIRDFNDIEAVLVSAQETLGHLADDNPLYCPALAELAVWDSGPEDNADLMMTLNIPGLRLATEMIQIRDFRVANSTPGAPVVRVVIGELLTYRNRLLHDLVVLACTHPNLGSLATYAEHLGLSAADLAEHVRESASRTAAKINDAGLREQVAHLVRNYRHANVRYLIDQHVAAARTAASDPTTPA
ncbi:hypothetical protein [Streptosporangium sp. NPDC002524]|uniref:hypothetical protein n=1 Tax=Streptosporangium sp. NPDC002524 TaxID=3154537 RepID=UPI00331CC6C5